MFLRPSCIAIDTNVLLLLIGYRCLLNENANALQRARVLTGIRGRDDNIPADRFDELWRFFENAPRRVVTEHIIAETYGLRRLLGFKKDLIWRSALSILNEHPGIEERHCSVKNLAGRDAYRKILIELGPTDAGLIFTAERLKAAIITDDRELAHWASVRSLPAIGFSEIGVS